jgi:hypothetical protein
MKRFVSVLLLGVLVLASVVAADDVPEVSARDMVLLYRENRVRFDRLYLNKKVQVTGELESVGMSKGAPSLTLRDGSLMGMFVYCRASELDAAADLDKGEEVTVVGRCDATLGKITLMDCVIK